MMWAQLYSGCKCGQTWRVYPLEGSTEASAEQSALFCVVCNLPVGPPLLDGNGRPIVHELTPEEAEEEFWTDVEEEEEGFEEL